MAYNPYNAVNMIYKFKNDWTDADKSGNAVKKFDAESNAKKYYEELKKNGYADVADELSKSNAEQAAKRRKFYAQTGRSATRDYLYSLGKKYDMTENDVDNLISYNDTTGEISFGGKNIGKPDAVADGVSYWNDTSKLDTAFKDYIDRSGTVRSVGNSINQENEKLFDKYSKEYDDLKKTNPFTTDEAKAILAKYDLAGMLGRDNTAADGAASNGGNIDSYAAANALRQQAALVSQGQQKVLDSYNSKLEHARNLLSDMGVNIERVFNENETAKNNDVSRKATVADVTGYVPSEWSLQTDPVIKQFVDENGKIKNEYKGIDFQQLINKAKENGNNELAKKYAILRGIKILGDFKQYGQYANDGDIEYIAPQKTESSRQFDEQIAASDRALMAESENNAAERQNKLDQINAEGQNAINQINAEGQSKLDQIKAAAEADKNLPNGSEDSGNNTTPPLSDSEVKEWVKYLNNDISSQYGDEMKALKEVNKGEYRRADADADYIITKIFSSNNLTQEQKEYLLYDKFGITADQVNTAIKDPHYSR